MSPEIDEKIAKIRERVFKQNAQNALSLEKSQSLYVPQESPHTSLKIREKTPEKFEIPHIFLKNASDFISTSPNLYENLEKKENKEKSFIKPSPLRKNPKKSPQKLHFSPEKKPNNIKENIRKLKQIYHDKSFVNLSRNEGFSKNESIKEERIFNDSPLKKEAYLKNSSGKSDNLQSSLNFSESRNFSTPKLKNLGPFPHEKNQSLIKRIDFDSELNYSLSQKEDLYHEDLEKNDPILKELRSEAFHISEEIE